MYMITTVTAVPPIRALMSGYVYNRGSGKSVLASLANALRPQRSDDESLLAFRCITHESQILHMVMPIQYRSLLSARAMFLSAIPNTTTPDV